MASGAHWATNCRPESGRPARRRTSSLLGVFQHLGRIQSKGIRPEDIATIKGGSLYQLRLVARPGQGQWAVCAWSPRDCASLRSAPSGCALSVLIP
jgi:hypothetical protein